MEFEFKARPVQTRIKHLILEQYLKSWGGIILNGRKRWAGQSGASTHFVYVDTHAYAGRYKGEHEDVAAGESEELVFGSPIIGIQAMDSLMTMANKLGVLLTTNIILIEEDKAAFNELLVSLEIAGLSPRVRTAGPLHTLKNQEIAVIHADCTTLTRNLLQYTGSDKKYAFYFIDPYGPVPSGFVSPIIAQPSHDCIIYMPYLDLGRKAGCLVKPEMSSVEQKLIHNYDEMFGSTEWHQVVQRYYRDKPLAELVGKAHPSEITTEALENDLATCYKETLLRADPSLSVKRIPLRFAERDRTLYYLYLTTRDPTGALRMNRILHEAGLQEHELRWRYQESKRQATTGQMSMFDEAPAPLIPKRPSAEDVASRIKAILGGRTLSLRDVYRAMADEAYFAEEIQKGLRKLREDKLCSYEGAKFNNEMIISVSR